MTKTILLATTAILLTAGTAAAQTPPSTPTAPAADASQQGVLVFTPDFFADQRPNTALDMVVRVPGSSVLSRTLVVRGERTVFADRSAARPIAFTELRPTDPRTFWQIRLRKTF